MTLLAEILIYVFCAVLALGAYVCGISYNFFGLISDPTQATLASFFAGIVIFIIGDRITSGIREHLMKISIADSTAKAFAGVPEINNVIEFPTSDHAMRYLASRLPSASVVLNTKISKAGVAPRSDVGAEFRKNLVKGLKNGLTYKDIVSPHFSEDAQALLNDSEAYMGSYSFIELQDQPACFVNFIVLQYETGDQELLLGWATSTYMGTEQKAYKIRDRRIIEFFKHYHAALFNG